MNGQRIGRQAGFSLIEVLISIAIGLVILIAIGLVYQTSTSIQRQQDNYDEIHAPVRMVTGMLQGAIAQAGYLDLMDSPGSAFNASIAFDPSDPEAQNSFVRDPDAGTPKAPLQRIVGGLFPVFGCDGPMNSSANALAIAAPPLTWTCGSPSAPLKNTLQIAYQVAPSATNSSTFNSLPAKNSATGEGYDCLQQDLPSSTNAGSAAKKGIAITRFYVTTNNGVNELYCEASGNANGQPIARGVEEFVLRYQLAQAGSSTNGVAGAGKSQYLTAAEVAADTVGWPGVSAVEICMVVATTAADGASDLQPKRPTCERETSGAPAGEFKADLTKAAADKRYWKRFNFTVALRNSIYALQ